MMSIGPNSWNQPFLVSKKRWFPNVSIWTRDKKRILFFFENLCLFAWTHGVPQIAWQVPQSLNAPLWEGEGWLTPVSWGKLMKIHNLFASSFKNNCFFYLNGKLILKQLAIWKKLHPFGLPTWMAYFFRFYMFIWNWNCRLNWRPLHHVYKWGSVWLLYFAQVFIEAS